MNEFKALSYLVITISVVWTMDSRYELHANAPSDMHPVFWTRLMNSG
jgi:hypothetical protein